MLVVGGKYRANFGPSKGRLFSQTSAEGGMVLALPVCVWGGIRAEFVGDILIRNYLFRNGMYVEAPGLESECVPK